MERVSMRRSFPLTKGVFSEVKDLELAAELGRSLLDRNEQLETELKSQQLINDDQAQEIEFLSKQISSMKEESLNRTKFYEQLETSLYELERTNSQLGRKREVDRTRIQRMGENIDYLERKCEELSGTLETFRDAHKKQFHGKLQSDYFGFVGSSDSSEDGNNAYGYRRRSQSLHDLRDYSSSPDDDFDSNHSEGNSADLKSSENEFIQALETRVEDLMEAKKKEAEKTAILETQLRILIQENTNLQQQLTTVTVEKEEQLQELRKLLLDHTSSTPMAEPGSPIPLPDLMSPSTPVTIGQNTPTRSLNGFRTPSSSRPYKTGEISHHHAKVGAQHSSICKRCSTEINILNLVNSIEFENDDYSSLEYELARANSSESSSPGQGSVCSDKSPSGASAQPSLFEHGFLDHFFGTNSILKKIRMRSEECLLEEDAFDEVELLKDLGPENYQKTTCDQDGEQRSPTTVTIRKLEVPHKIFDEAQAPDQASELQEKVLEKCNKLTGTEGGFDDSICDSAEVTVSTKKRSKLWWLVWLVLLVLGVVQVTWQASKLLFWFLLATLLPRPSSAPSPARINLKSSPYSRLRLPTLPLTSSRKLL